jgi:hypothetical protein
MVGPEGTGCSVLAAMSGRQLGTVIALVGLVAALIAALANPLGIGHQGFGWKQGLLLGVGIVLIIAGVAVALRSPKAAEPGPRPPPGPS